MKPIEAIYIHIPFCVKKCNYCDFFSVANPMEMEAYIDALQKEILLVKKTYPLCVKTIFVGGGTPSCLPERLLEKLLYAIREVFVGPSLKEYTFEVNPGTVNEKKLKLMINHDVNRLSFGVQSDNAEQLKFLGRIHSFSEAVDAVSMARKVGFDNINLDFIYGVPGQSPEDWKNTLENAIGMEPQHLSLYQLKIENGTPLAHLLEQGAIQEFDDEIALKMYRMNQEMLEKAGYRQYEISNYAKKGMESLHNQTYWKTENYIGMGLTACSWLSPERRTNTTSFKKYAELLGMGIFPYEEKEILTEKEQMEEMVFMALRMNRGLLKKDFRERFGKNPGIVFSEAIEKCIRNQWLEETSEQYRLTQTGRVLGNLVFMEFLLD